MITNPVTSVTAGIDTFFVILIALAFFYYVFTVLIKRGKRDADKKSYHSQKPEGLSGQSVGESGTVSSELIAIIAAAIAATEGMSASDVRIASIHPIQTFGGFNTPVWGRIERMIRK
jgi:hypothetical protein